MVTSRRQFLLAATGGITAISGCSAFSDPQQALVVVVNNYTGSPHQGHVLVERDGTEVVHQYLEVAASEPDEGQSVETKVELGQMPSDVTLDVEASFGDDLEATGQHTLDCTEEYTGRAIHVHIEPETPPIVRLNLPCYDEFPTNEEFRDETDRS